ncbi:hypothetical protein [Micromonospora zhanjiangensis]
MNAVMMVGLLHHLSDREAEDLLELAARALAPEGTVVSVDNCFEPEQGRVARWMSAHDRGQHVREPESLVALAQKVFKTVDGTVIRGITRIPYSFWMMRMGNPLPRPDLDRSVE